MDELRVCPVCLAELAGDSPDGLCPHCSRRIVPGGSPSPIDPGAGDAGGARSLPIGSTRVESTVAGSELVPAWGLGCPIPEPAWDPAVTPVTKDPGPSPAESIPSTRMPEEEGDRGGRGGAGGAIDGFGPGVRFGDYELQEKISQGGMGVVYRARQVSLNRVVALKVILAGGLATPEDIQRFMLEAESAANLDHPNIVPIYEVGEHRGRHYFSMKLVEGGSLSRRVAGLLDDPKSSARLMVLTARGVHAAHQRGILHRDLKPANILVDALGQPHVTDFGLAKRVEADSRLTRSGAILGTPSYMAPEQAAGHHASVTTAADVYGLGAILYELLAGRPPFRGPTVMATLAQVMGQEPARPRSIRKGVDPDLETICLKCLEKDPARRYGSAEALADDLERWLAGEPILARACSTRERVVKWARRRPAIAAMAGLTAAAIALGLGGAIWGWRLAEIQRALADRKAAEAGRSATAALRAEQDARTQQERAERGFRQLRGALDQFFTQVSESNLLNQPGLQPLRRTLLQAALENYQQILLQWGDDPGVRIDLGKARLRLALVTGEIDSWPKAIALLEQARATFDGLGRSGSRNADYATLLAKADNGLGILYAATGRLAQAEGMLREALAILEPLALADSSDPDARRDLAKTRHNLGRLAYALGRRPEAESFYKAALEIERPLALAGPSDLDARRDLAKTLNNLGDVLLNEGKAAEAESSYGEALRLRARLVEDQPVPFARNDLATSHASLGVLHYAAGRPAEAEAAYRRALALWEPLVEANPAVTQFRRNLAAACNNLGVLYNAARRYGEAEAPFRRALELEERLARDDPNELYREEMAASRNNLGLVYASSGRGREAGAEFEEARKIREQLVRDHPESAAHRRELATTCSNLGFHHRIAGRTAEAVAAYERALAYRRRSVAERPDDFRSRIELATDLGELALSHRVAREVAPAEEAYREARDIREGLARDRPEDAENRRAQAAIHHGLGLLHRNAGAMDEAQVDFARALSIRTRLAEQCPDDAEIRVELASTHDGLGAVLQQAGRPADAEATYRASLAIRRRLVEERPNDVDLRRDLAATWNNLGLVYGGTRRAREAEAAYQKAREEGARLVAERPDDLECVVDLGGYDANLAELLQRGGDLKAALEAYTRAILVLERAVDRDGGPPEARAFLRNALWGRAEVHARRGRREPALDDWGRAIEVDPGPLRPAIRVDRAVALARWGRHAQAVAEADALVGDPSLSAAALVNLARAYSLATTIGLRDRASPPGERHRDSDRYADRAIGLLARSLTGHFFDNPARGRALDEDPDFGPLRNRGEFREILAKVGHRDIPKPTTSADHAPGEMRSGPPTDGRASRADVDRPGDLRRGGTGP